MIGDQPLQFQIPSTQVLNLIASGIRRIERTILRSLPVGMIPTPAPMSSGRIVVSMLLFAGAAALGSRRFSQRSPRLRRDDLEACEFRELLARASRKRSLASAASCAARAASALAANTSSCSDDTELLGEQITCSMASM